MQSSLRHNNKKTSAFGILIGLALAVHPSPNLAAQDDPFSIRDIEYFEKKVRPVLVNRCYDCHSSEAKTVQGGLKVDSLTELTVGGDSGPAVVPGDTETSLLVQSIQYSPDADFQMPPKGKIPDSEIAILTDWVRRGAPFPGKTKTAPRKKPIDFAKARNFWSYVPARQQQLPVTELKEWPAQRLDHFVLAKMEKMGLSPSAETSRANWLRRVTFDLIGLPPSKSEVTDFVNDDAPDAYEKAADRLLDSPHFGERWGRVWLDLARYTDRNADWLHSTGQAHLYRDWVVQAMNDDLPYDQFVKRQLATDCIPETGPEDIPALGFLGLSPNYWKELKLPSEIIKVIVADEWEERIDAVSRTFLGLTVACARCHDHKFDAITMQDYYGLAGVFASSRILERPLIDEEKYAVVRQAKKEIAALQASIKRLQSQKPLPSEKIDEQKLKIKKLKQIKHFDTPLTPAVVDESLHIQRKGSTPQSGTKLVYLKPPRDLHVFIRGNPNRPGKIAPRQFLTVLSDPNSPKLFKNGSGRIDLANAITNQAASLTARVWVNRIWAEHFGTGLVATPSNFGVSGVRPTHPDLLDDLAARLVAANWTTKQLHREIVLSSTYRQASQRTKKHTQIDPDNQWLSRMNRRRLNVEAWRDAMLAVSGELSRAIGGPSIDLNDPLNRRRTLYATIHRREMSRMLLTHDFPDPTAHSPKRISTTTPLQGLYALNGPMILDRSRVLAARLINDPSKSNRDRINEAYQLLFARRPSKREVQLGIEFLSQTKAETVDIIDSWTQYCHVLLASNEFLYIN